MVIFDVENSSRVEHVTGLVEHLGLATLDGRTALLAVGNWAVVAQETARILARHGGTADAQRTEAAREGLDRPPYRGGCGLLARDRAARRPAQIVTDDQAFDAVGDVASGYGVLFERLAFRDLLARAAVAPVPPKRRARRHSRRSRSNQDTTHWVPHPRSGRGVV